MRGEVEPGREQDPGGETFLTVHVAERLSAHDGSEVLVVARQLDAMLPLDVGEGMR